MDVFNSNGEVYENACDLPPAAETVAVPRAAEEESRDVRAGVLRYLIKLVNYSCILNSVPVAQWLEHCVSSTKVVGSIPREHTY